MLSKFSLEKAVANDADEIADVFMESRKGMTYLPDSLHTPDETRQWIRGLIEDDANTILKAVSEHRGIAGFCGFREGWVDHLYVRPAYQGQGIGSRMLKAAQESQGHLEVWVFQQNIDAIRLYERNGFRVAERTDGSRNEEHEPDVRLVWDK
ncbi:MAG TPA: GNAT family N-acetyltransferase [Candidatus Saccharimonadia bacterium]|jgi:ribosomal protein S18 acetylase RimI-like enzyme